MCQVTADSVILQEVLRNPFHCKPETPSPTPCPTCSCVFLATRRSPECLGSELLTIDNRPKSCSTGNFRHRLPSMFRDKDERVSDPAPVVARQIPRGLRGMQGLLPQGRCAKAANQKSWSARQLDPLDIRSSTNECRRA